MSFIFRIIENIRSKPKGARKRIAVFLALLLTLIIFLFWLYITPQALIENKDDAKNEELNQNIDIATPLENIKEEISNLGQIFNDLKDQFDSATSTN